MRKLFFTQLLLGLFIITKAQILQTPTSVPSPQAWNFTQYGKLPISFFTGLPNINIPLDELNAGGFKLPISINYNVGSVRPDIHPGVTGMGWNIALGGAVTRKVRGLTDEFYFQQSVNYLQQGVQTNTYFNGYRNNSNAIYSDLTPASILATTKPMLCQGTINDCGNPTYNTARNIPQILPFLWDNVSYMQPNCFNGCTFYWLKHPTDISSDRWDKWNNSGGGVIDQQADEFSFNVMGLSGKFYLSRGAVTTVSDIICNRKVQISVSSTSQNIDLPSQLAPPQYNGPSGTSDNFYFNMSPWQKNQKYPQTIWSFSIKDEDGTVYHFGRTVTDLNYNAQPAYAEKDAIEYGINIYDISQDYWTADAWYLTRISPLSGPSINFEYQRGPFQTNMYLSSFESNVTGTSGSGLFDKYDRNGRLIYSTNLSRVYSEGFELKLHYSESNQLKYEDANANVYSIKPGVPQLLNNCYEYTGPSNIKWLKLDQLEVKRNDGAPVYYNFSYNNQSSKRLMLEKVSSGLGQGDVATYLFTYDNSYNLPNYLSGQTDHWGFWNGKTPTSNDPAVYYQDKEPNAQYLFAGTLTQIQYPTGGKTVFTYEPNEYGKKVGPVRTNNPLIIGNTIGGGLRIKKIADYDAIHSSPYNSREFIYKTGFNNQLSQNQIDLLPSSGVLNMQPQYYWDGTVPYYNPVGASGSTVFSVRSTQPLFYSTDDYQIGYSEIAEKLSNNSYSVYRFSNHDNGYKDESYELALNDVFNSPYTKFNSKALERGQLLEKKDFDASNNLVYKKTITYKANDISKPGIIDQEASYFNNSTYGGGSYPKYDKWVLFGTRYKLFTYLFVPDIEEEVLYQPGQNPSQTSRQYFYGNPLHGKPTKIVMLNSKQDELTTILKYPKDFPGEFMFNNLANNLPGTVLEKLQLLKRAGESTQYITGAELNEYSLSVGANMPWLNSSYKLELTKPLSYNDFTQTSHITRSFNDPKYPKDTRYKELLKFNKYDNYYRPLDALNGTKERIFWVYGNLQNQLTAIVKSRYYTENADKPLYTSFEPFSYKTNDGYTSTGIDGDADFEYITGSSTSTNYSFSGSHSFIGQVRFRSQIYGSNIYVLSKTGGSLPAIEVLDNSNNVISTTSFTKIGERQGWDICKVSPGGGIKIRVNSNGNYIDELRAIPAGADVSSKAEMSTYTYKNGNVSGIVDKNFNRLSYEYDGFGRLIIIRDQDGNINKRICYNYAGQIEECVPPVVSVFKNSAQGQLFYNNDPFLNCGRPTTPGPIYFYVPAEKYTSTISQADADQKALTEITTNGQTYANTQIHCIRASCANCNTQSDPSLKCVNNACQKGFKWIYFSEFNSGTQLYTCRYKYVWSDGAMSIEYTETSSNPCQ